VTASIEQRILDQWEDDRLYVETCEAVGFKLDENATIEARLRASGPVRDFLIQKLQREWSYVAIITLPTGERELSLRRDQPLTLQAIRTMTAELIRLAEANNLHWLNWCEFDGQIYRTMHRTPLAWTFEGWPDED
jgi:hypothetical protein